MRKIVVLLFAFSILSCKSKIKIAEAQATENSDIALIIDGINANKIDFNTAVIRANIKYDSDDTGLSAGADIKIKKDEKILISLKVVGLVMAKALITPDRVQYYQKTGDKYFDGDYSTISKFAGTELNFQKVQNLLLGKPVDSLTVTDFTSAIVGSYYELKSKSRVPQSSSYQFEAGNFFLKQTEVVRETQNQSVAVSYNGYTLYGKTKFPIEIKIVAKENSKMSKIEIEYKDVKLDENISFPYNVPNGYERITID